MVMVKKESEMHEIFSQSWSMIYNAVEQWEAVKAMMSLWLWSIMLVWCQTSKLAWILDQFKITTYRSYYFTQGLPFSGASQHSVLILLLVAVLHHHTPQPTSTHSPPPSLSGIHSPIPCCTHPRHNHQKVWLIRVGASTEGCIPISIHWSRVWVADANTDTWKLLEKTTKQSQKCFCLLHIMLFGTLKSYHNPR